MATTIVELAMATAVYTVATTFFAITMVSVGAFFVVAIETAAGMDILVTTAELFYVTRAMLDMVGVIMTLAIVSANRCRVELRLLGSECT